jgi:hypothetical protein
VEVVECLVRRLKRPIVDILWISYNNLLDMGVAKDTYPINDEEEAGVMVDMVDL